MSTEVMNAHFSEQSGFRPKFTMNAINGSGNIDDDHILPTSTWSSQKINTMLLDKANTSALAPSYTQGSSYAVGDYCSYNGNMYQCVTAIASAGAFDSTKWNMVTVMVAVTDVMPKAATSAQVAAIISGYTPT